VDQDVLGQTTQGEVLAHTGRATHAKTLEVPRHVTRHEIGTTHTETPLEHPGKHALEGNVTQAEAQELLHLASLGLTSIAIPHEDGRSLGFTDS
jgi:hypothetical protein